MDKLLPQPLIEINNNLRIAQIWDGTDEYREGSVSQFQKPDKEEEPPIRKLLPFTPAADLEVEVKALIEQSRP